MDERPYDGPESQESPTEGIGELESAAVVESAAPSAVPWWRQPGPAIIAGAVIIAAGVGAGIAFAGSNGDGKPGAAASPSASPSAVLLNGTLTIPFLGSDLFTPNARDTERTGGNGPVIGDPCIALGGYNDISTGTAVTIGGDKGQTLAVGALGGGAVAGQPGQPASCAFTFSVDVPAGQPLYTVTISHRGTQTFTPAQVATGIDLTLGQQQ
jgi:hypothetical protein